MSSVFNQFINQYQVSRTLRFALKPIGKTDARIKEKGLLQKDEERAEKYKQAKKIIDEYHKAYIQERLSCFQFAEQELQEFAEAYNALKQKNDDEVRKTLEKQQAQLRKKVAEQLKNGQLFNAEFIKNKLPEWLQQHPVTIEAVDNPESIIRDFQKWTTYFTGFNENRKNIYTSKPHSTSIGYRLIHENLPKFLDNMERYKKARELGVDFSEVEQDFQEELDKLFSLTSFNKCLTQEGIERYNLIRGGQNKQNNEKRQGVNEKINLHAQQLQILSTIRKLRSCQLEQLHKQILSDRNTTSFRLEDIDNDAALCKQISTFRVDSDDNLIGRLENINIDTGEATTKDFNITESLNEALDALKEADPAKIYLRNDRTLTDISKHLFDDWDTIERCLEYYAEKTEFPTPEGKKITKTLSNKREQWLKKSYFSFADIHKALATRFEQYTEDELQNEDNSQDSNKTDIKKQKEIATSKPLIGYFTEATIRKKNESKNAPKKIKLLNEIKANYDKAVPVLQEYKTVEQQKLKGGIDKVRLIKNYLDALMDLQRFLKPLHIQLKEKEQKQAEAYEKDGGFYSKFDDLYKVISQITPLYNKTRNYLTQKPYSVEKYKLNFENQTLAAGWDKNKEKDNTCVLLMKDKQYFLGIMDKDNKTLFEDKNTNTNELRRQIEQKELLVQEKQKLLEAKKEGTTIYKSIRDEIMEISNKIGELRCRLELLQDNKNIYQKMVYKQVADAGKDIQNLIKIDGSFARRTRNLATLKEENIPDIAKIKNSGSYLQTGDDNFSRQDLITFIDYYKEAAEHYWNWCNFYFRESGDYKNFKEFTDDINRQGYKITFQNISVSYVDQCVQDGKLYLFQIYSKDFSSKTRGKPNLHTLYWKALFDEQNLRDTVYKLNGEAELFHRKSSLKYTDKIWKTGHHANDSKKKQSYPIIKDRRYAKDTYLFHVPVTCNFKAAGRGTKFNDKVNKYLKDSTNVNIIGIDRGERHLAYYTVIDRQGTILKDKDGEYLQGSFNNPLGNKDYHDLLNEREMERDQARKSWGTIQKIKDLKEGYLSQVVHKIAKLMVEHNAIVVFEDLNFGFKRGRLKVEKQVYQKLEKMLIDKLNYLVFKDSKPDEPGGARKALQLTARFESFQKLGKQTGFIFYTPAYYTSKVCPATGFVNLLYPRYETVRKAQEFFNKFDKICFNSNANHFEFHFNYKKFTEKAEGSKQDWIVCTHGERLENKRNGQSSKWDSHEVDLVSEVKKLFSDNSIEFNGGKCLIQEITAQSHSYFFKQLMRFLKLTLQMRNSRIGTDEDWLVSPIKDKQGDFFDSRNVSNSMPQNADANGAYHIALKGLLMLTQLRASTENRCKPLKNKAWYEFVQKNKQC